MRAPWHNKNNPKPDWLSGPPKKKSGAHRAWVYWNKIWRAQPGWANRNKIKAIYALADHYKELGFEVEVDHVVPLAHPLVCGLHWEGNLTIRTKLDNQNKSNDHWPDMPDELQLTLF